MCCGFSSPEASAALCETVVEGLPDDAGLGLLGVAEAAGLVDLLAGQTQIGDGGWPDLVLLGNEVCTCAGLPNLSTRLSSIVLVGQPPLGERFDLKRVSPRVTAYLIMLWLLSK